MDVKLIKSIYNYITPILVANEELIEYDKNDPNLKVFEFFSDMCNIACHQFSKQQRLKPIFNNLVKFYHIFDVDLLKMRDFQRFWKRKDFKKSIEKFTESKNEEMNEVKHVQFYDDFKKLLHLLRNFGNESEETNKSRLKLIYKYVTPIIMWYQNAHSKNNLLLEICNSTKDCVCQLSKKVGNKNNLKKFIENIAIIYGAFGIDPCNEIQNIQGILPNDKNEEVSGKLESMLNVISDNIRNDQNGSIKKNYFLFDKVLSNFISTEHSEIDMILILCNYSSPFVIMSLELTIKKEKSIVFEFVRNMLNTACQLILDKKYIIPRFVNIVKFYQICKLDLIKKFERIEELWELIPSYCKEFKLHGKNLLTIKDAEINKVKDKHFEEFTKNFKEMLHFLHGSGKIPEMLINYGEQNKTEIKLIYKYVAPIIIWCKNVESQFENEYSNDLLYKINIYTRNCVCHFTEKMINEDELKQIVENICVIYLAFGIDLFIKSKKVREILINRPSECEFLCIVITDHNVENMKIKKSVDETITEIRNFFSTKNNFLKEKYFLFGKCLHYCVSTKILSGALITHLFLGNTTNIKWSNNKNRFVFKDSDNNSNKEWIIQHAGPFFVWIEFVNNYEKSVEKEFYNSINEIKQEIINYLITNKLNTKDKNNIIQKMKSIHEPIENFYDKSDKSSCLNNIKNIGQYNLFRKLVYYSVICRKERIRLDSFVFKHYSNKKEVTENEKNTAKLYDIFKFCGLFYIFVNYIEETNNDSHKLFYKKVKELTDLITCCMENDRKLRNRVVDDMKSVFDDFCNIVPYDDDFYKMFSQLLSCIVTSRINDNNSDEDVDAIADAEWNLEN